MWFNLVMLRYGCNFRVQLKKTQTSLPSLWHERKYNMTGENVWSVQREGFFYGIVGYAWLCVVNLLQFSALILK